MRLEFLMCGSPTDAFWSQAAMFRVGLDALGGAYASARQALCLGAPGEQSIPDRWRPWFERIEVQWTDEAEYRERGGHAQNSALYGMSDSSADLSIICDADTLLLRPLPDEFLERSTAAPAVSGVIAHYPPPLSAYPGTPVRSLAGADQLWDALSEEILGRPIVRPYGYTLLKGSVRAGERCPFYVNHGFIAGPPGSIAALGDQVQQILPQVRGILDNDFCYQLAIPYALERAGIDHHVLPMRFNYPLDPVCDRLYPREVCDIRVAHYLRPELFDRHRIFAETEAFHRFMTLPLVESNEVFRDAVRRLTDGRFPFPE